MLDIDKLRDAANRIVNSEKFAKIIYTLEVLVDIFALAVILYICYTILELFQ
jgi:hypothetical protein